MDAVLGDAQIIDMSAESAERRLYIKVRFSASCVRENHLIK